MIWVGSFRSLQSVLGKPGFSEAPLEVHTWVRSEISLISHLGDWLISLIATTRCVSGREDLVELALQEAVSNAMLHGNRLDSRKLVHVRCCCEFGKGVFLVVRDQGHGFDPDQVPDPLAFENLNAEHGRGIHLMRLAMDEVYFARNGTEVHLHKAPVVKEPVLSRPCHAALPQWLVRPSLQAPCCRMALWRPPSHNSCRRF